MPKLAELTCERRPPAFSRRAGCGRVLAAAAGEDGALDRLETLWRGRVERMDQTLEDKGDS